MADLKITFNLSDYDQCRKILETVFETLGWKFQRIINQVSYGGFCNIHKISEDTIGVSINETSDQKTKDFLRTLCNHSQDIREVEILSDKQSEYIVYNSAYDAPANVSIAEGQYVKINYLMFK